MSYAADIIESQPTFDSETLSHYWPDGSVFDGYPCMDCGRASTDWAAGDDEWNKVMGDGAQGHICPDCFIRRAHKTGVHLHVVRYCSDGDE